MFLHNQWPEGFEFPACLRCNGGTSDDDLLIAMLGRMSSREQNSNADGRLPGLFQQVRRQFPGLLDRMMPSAVEARASNQRLGIEPLPGLTHQETGVMKVPEEMNGAVRSLAGKLSKGIFFRDAGQIFPKEGCLLMRWFTNAELVRDGTYAMFDLLQHLSGDAPRTVRSGTFLDDQFSYKFSLATERTTFVLQCRFSETFGFVVFGSSDQGLLESGVVELERQTGTKNPFEVLQSPALESVVQLPTS
jgi:hypothetical protein